MRDTIPSAPRGQTNLHRRAKLTVGHTYAEPGLDLVTVAGIAFHGDTVLVTRPMAPVTPSTAT
ncbi:MAG: hypothetical protein M3301_04080, partial [Chloroflexota bacterium]|nr:hypothetical protein [Chloroflexota bacterium]